MKKKIGIIIIIILAIVLIVSINIIKNSNSITEISNSEKTQNEIEQLETEEYLSSNIEKILIISHLTTDTEAITKEVTDVEEITEFMKLLNKTSWEENEDDTLNITDNECIKEFILINCSTNTKIKLYSETDTDGYVSVEQNDTEILYTIDKSVYKEIFAFNEETFYLHDSSLEIPSNEQCLEAQQVTFQELTDKEVEEIKEQIRISHNIMEALLVEGVSLLKEPESSYWNTYITGEEMKDVASEELFSFGDEFCFNYILNNIQALIKTIKNIEVLSDLEECFNILQEGINNHDISKLFEAHKILHDYDIWVIEYPISNLTIEPVEWKGLTTYFGKVNIIK